LIKFNIFLQYLDYTKAFIWILRICWMVSITLSTQSLSFNYHLISRVTSTYLYHDIWIITLSGLFGSRGMCLESKLGWSIYLISFLDFQTLWRSSLSDDLNIVSSDSRTYSYFLDLWLSSVLNNDAWLLNFFSLFFFTYISDS
jgi:hypothetical protein